MEDYQPIGVAVHLHHASRFGHTNQIGRLASSDSALASDYIHGLVAFCVFMSVMLLAWIIVLLIVKCRYTVDRVGCAAGGGVIHLGDLRKAGLSRRARKRRILRSWRVQTAFLLSALCVPVLSFLLLNQGLNTFVHSLSDLLEITDDVDAVAYRGIQVVVDLTKEYQKVLGFSQFDIQQFCPDYQSSRWAKDQDFNLLEIQSQVMSGLGEVESFIQDSAQNNIILILLHVTNATKEIDHGITWIQEHDWIVKLFLIFINVINLFLLFGVLLAKSSVDLVKLQAMFAYFFVPTFCFLNVILLGWTCLFVAISFINADLCTGGADPGSPGGALQDALYSLGYDTESFAQRALTYYSSDCLTENPFSFLDITTNQVQDSKNDIDSLVGFLGTINATDYASQCGTDIETVFESFSNVDSILASVRGSLSAATDITDCSRITPILRRLYFGETCVQSVQGLCWLFSTMLAMNVVALVMVTTRAGLYNPIIRPKRKKRREKEFKEYMEYMSSYYDTSQWMMDPAGYYKDSQPKRSKRRRQKHCEDQLEADMVGAQPNRVSTFETDSTIHVSASDCDKNNQKYARTDDRSDAGDNLEGPLQQQSCDNQEDDEYSYYSSDSAESDEMQPSVVSLASSIISSAASVITTTVRKLLAEHLVPKAILGQSISDDVESALPDWPEEEEQQLSGRQFMTPRRRRISSSPSTKSASGTKNKYNTAPVNDEMQALSPISLLLQAPRKPWRSIPRTNGAAKYNPDAVQDRDKMT